MPSERLLPRLFLILLVAVLALAGWQWRHGAPLSANLMELVPGNTPDALEQQAEQRMQEPLNRELLVLVGHADRQQAVAVAQQLGEHWQASGLFEKCSGTCKPICRRCASSAARSPGDALGQGPRATDRAP